MSVDAIAPGHVAVVTGGAAGIGLAAAERFADNGMVVVIADTREELFDAAVGRLRARGAIEALARKVDVSDRAAVETLEAEVRKAFGATHVLMNNAGIQPGSDIFDAAGTWGRVLAVNLMGVVNGAQVFAPGMIAGDAPGLIINTGSKQGITTPPGDPAYNVSKAGVKAFSEALEHELREATGGRVSAHLLIPGFVFTDLTRRDRTEKPAGAWTPEQTADFLMDSLGRGDFYILCPDNDVDRATDEKRMAWAMGDIIENRPPLSRWAKGYAEKFEAFLKGDN
jgi:NAD(P)-dependent dehydrogenase (short-subunit alcohol dehydrogenase family)